MRPLAFAIVWITFSTPNVLANPYVNDNLNAADQMFNHGLDGCMNVSMAIMAANNPSVFGPTASNLKSEIKSYANKCNLRY